MATTDSCATGAPGRANNWYRWGADDERGALNLLGPGTVRRAAAAITSGHVYSLGIPIQQRDVPLIEYRGTPMRLTLQDSTDEGTAPPEFDCAPGTGSHEDVLVMASHTTSHMDALIHVYHEYRHYNGIGYKTMQATAGATKLGIDKVGAVAARGVLLDMVGYFGCAEDWIPPGRVITANDLQGAARKQGIEIRAGDAVLIRTGYLQYWLANRPGPEAISQPGIGLDAGSWLAAQDVVVVGSDNAAVEVIPFDQGDFLGVHKTLLVDHGIYLIEYLDLAAPARAGDYVGLFTVGPLKVTGATGSPVNPVFVT